MFSYYDIAIKKESQFHIHYFFLNQKVKNQLILKSLFFDFLTIDHQ